MFRGRCELEADDARDDEHDANDAQHLARFAEEGHADDRRAGCADARPNGITRADGDSLERDRQESKAGDHDDKRRKRYLLRSAQQPRAFAEAKTLGKLGRSPETHRQSICRAANQATD